MAVPVPLELYRRVLSLQDMTRRVKATLRMILQMLRRAASCGFCRTDNSITVDWTSTCRTCTATEAFA